MLLIDDRVGSRDLLPGLQRAGMEACLQRLEYADIAFMGRGIGGAPVAIGIELKNISDLCQSLRTGRLSGHQVPGLTNAYDYRWLIVEGTYDTDRQGRLVGVRRRGQSVPLHGHMTLNEVEGRLLTLELQTGLRVKTTPNRASTLQWLVRLYRWWNDVNMEAHTSHLMAHEPPRPLGMTDKQALFTKLPGVGPRMAKHVEAHFGSIRRAMNADVGEWASVGGTKRLGMATARHIVKFVEEE